MSGSSRSAPHVPDPPRSPDAAASPTATGTDGGAGVPRGVLPVVMVALATVVSAVASLNVALPSVARDTHASQTQLSWIIDAYALVFASLLLLGGAVGDRYGRRRALLVGLVVFGAGSAVAATVSDPAWLVGMRGLLGLGAALVMPATLSTITSTFPRQARARAVGVWAGVAGAGAVLGLLASGLLLELWSWRSVFVLNVVLAALALAGTARFVPESADPRAPRLDAVGAVFTVLGLGLVVYSVIEAPTRGWGSVRTLGGLGAGLVVLGGFVVWELTRREPLLDPRLFRRPTFGAGVASLTVQFFGFFGMVFLVLQYLQLVRGYSALLAAVTLLPMAAGMMPCARVLAPRLAARVGPLRVCVVGLTVAAGGLAVLSGLHPDSAYWLLPAGLFPLGAGMGLAMTPATTAITDALPRSRQGVGSAMNDLARELGGALGIAVLGSVLQSTYRSGLHPVGLPDAAAEQAKASPALAMRLGPAVAGQARAAFTDGMRTALLCAVVVVLLAALGIALVQLRTRSGDRTNTADAVTDGHPDATAWPEPATDAQSTGETAHHQPTLADAHARGARRRRVV